MTPPSTFEEIITLLVAYLCGSIPWGLFISWLFKLQDPRTAGSGNIGATNILRLGDKWAAFLTLLLDALKGIFAVLFAIIFCPSLAQLAGLLAIAGHIWPIWLGFRGGKGVATAFGVVLVLSWPLALSCLVSWLMIAITSRYSSLASVITVALSPLYAFILTQVDLIVFSLVLALLIIFTHRDNIKRLLTGKESQIGKDSPSNPTPSE
ncbi:MAG: glycerol-3-phosphate 1-O-acyltransferase PlsY [Proteobacteria bacterium]|nr:glycerol-3-phosphate 1-O-acyltransferase PlsY [Pseudomonadota bacterium]